MFNCYPLFWEVSVHLLFLFAQRTILFPFERNSAVFVNFCNSLISGIRKNKNMRLHSSSAFLEQSEIMRSSIAKIRRKNFSCLKINNYLNFLSEAFFLSAVIKLTLFLGRSTGCSEASIRTVFKSERHDTLFQPERWNISDSIRVSSIFLIVLHVADSLIP